MEHSNILEKEKIELNKLIYVFIAILVNLIDVIQNYKEI